MSEIFWVSIRIPAAQCHRAGYLLAAKARKQAAGVKIARVSSGASLNVLPGVDEHRACYMLLGVSLVKHPHEVWVFTDRARAERGSGSGLAYISAHRTHALAVASAVRIQSGPSFEGYCQVRAAA